MADPLFRVRLFGDVSADYGGEPVRIAVRPLCAVLFAMLVVKPGTRFPRRELAFELWPDENDSARANGNLRRHLSALAAALPGINDGVSWIESDGVSLAWAERQPFWCDALAFEEALTGADPAPDTLVAATDFMRGYSHDWVLARRENYRARVIDRLLTLCVERQDEDRLDDALAFAAAALKIDPLCEDAVQLAIELHRERGEPSAAGQVYAAFAERVQRELDARPSPATVAAIERVRSAANARRDRLPGALTSFVGRTANLEGLEGMLERERCVAVVGPGGTGKTRLVLETARRVGHRFVDGTYFIDLSTLAPGGEVVDAVVRGLELPTELASAGARGIERFLRHRRTLVILDNCEHVRDACAALAHQLLASAQRVTIVATSREALGIAAEAVYRLAPLSADEARALFVERTRRSGMSTAMDAAGLACVDRICALLDRSALAVELAAGLFRSMSLDDIERRLADRFAMLKTSDPSVPARHRTLEAAITWSFELLEPAERRLFERLAVFPGSFTFDSALKICGESADALIALIEKSMVQRDETHPDRYRLLFSLAAFAGRRFAAGPEAGAVRERHAAHFAAAAAFAHSPDYFRGEAPFFREIDLELENVRAALRLLLAEPPAEAQRGVQMAVALQRYFRARGYHAEGLAWLEAARLKALHGSRDYVRVCSRIGTLLLQLRRAGEALRVLEEAVALARAGNLPHELALALAELGTVGIRTGDMARARLCLDEALLLAERESLDGLTAVTLGNIGITCIAAGDVERGRICFSEAALLFRRQGDRAQVARMLDNLAGCEHDAGRHAEALVLLEEALLMARGVGDTPLLAEVLNDMGDSLLDAGRAAEAAGRFSEALTVAVPLGLPYATSKALLGFAGVAAAARDGRTAARLIGAASGVLEGDLALHANETLYRRTLAAASAQLDEAEFERERRLGELLELDAAIRLANGTSPVRN
jgi:predicted ATPase/DNA-binding SARP family transcriptional activator